MLICNLLSAYKYTETTFYFNINSTQFKEKSTFYQNLGLSIENSLGQYYMRFLSFRISQTLFSDLNKTSFSLSASFFYICLCNDRNYTSDIMYSCLGLSPAFCIGIGLSYITYYELNKWTVDFPITFNIIIPLKKENIFELGNAMKMSIVLNFTEYKYFEMRIGYAVSFF